MGEGHKIGVGSGSVLGEGHSGHTHDASTFPITVCLSSNYFHLFSGDPLVLYQEQPLNTNE